jgi:hypothetical protein
LRRIEQYGSSHESVVDIGQKRREDRIVARKRLTYSTDQTQAATSKSCETTSMLGRTHYWEDDSFVRKEVVVQTRKERAATSNKLDGSLCIHA